MPKPKPKKRKSKRPWKWILILLVVLLVIPAMQVAVVRFINPPLTLPMLIDQGGAMFSSAPTPPLRYRWIGLPQMPEMFLEHLWISEDQRFFQHEGFDWKEMDLAVKEAERKGKPVRGASTITNQCARSIFLWQRRSCIRKGLESYRVKGFASRGSQGTKRPDVLRLRTAVGERLRVLHRFLDGLEEAVVGA
jgi:monofunctional biosynthetic peptidoglycan transglycosylase